MPHSLARESSSVTRFGEVLPLWRNLWSSAILRVYLVFGKISTFFGNFLVTWVNCHCFKSPNSDKIIASSGHTAPEKGKSLSLAQFEVAKMVRNFAIATLESVNWCRLQLVKYQESKRE